MHRFHACVLLGMLAWQPATTRADDALTPAQAAAKVGQTVTVHMKVKATGMSTGGFADLLSEASSQHPDAFIVRISPECHLALKTSHQVALENQPL